ncbi:hypothetical protein BH18ACI4_BH18ACI4_26290 [soil metagenome]
MLFDERFLPDFLEAFTRDALLLAEACLAEAFLVEARLTLLAAARFLGEEDLVVVVEVLLPLFLAPLVLAVFLAAREVVDFFEAERRLPDFLADDPFRAFVVGISPP